MKRLEGKIAAVTGGGRGIGQAICHRLAQEGANVAIMDLGDMSETTTLCGTAGAQVLPLHLDVTSKTAVQKAVADIVNTWGRLDIWVNNAGIFDNTSTLEFQRRGIWDRVSDVNYKAMFLCSQATVPHMLKNNWGRIIQSLLYGG